MKNQELIKKAASKQEHIVKPVLDNTIPELKGIVDNPSFFASLVLLIHTDAADLGAVFSILPTEA